MGTHPNAPSMIKTDRGLIPLKEHLLNGNIDHHQSDHHRLDLPFLFKVLSVGKALSIQAHPDLQLAKVLHAKDPKNYKDPNHKPEMTIALSPFEALCGFRLIKDIVSDLNNVPELRGLVDASKVEALGKSLTQDEKNQKEALKELFAEFIAAEKNKVESSIENFVSRMTSINRQMTDLEELCLRLNGQYPGEVGCFCVFLFNYITLKPGEAIFLAANEPHAYLSGECVECMALSDNVVRAGLTPKFRDVQTLIEMLTYKSYSPEQLAMTPEKIVGRSHSRLYRPPVKEFAVIQIDLTLGQEERITTEASEAILLCAKGDLTIRKDGAKNAIKAGSILLLEAQSEYTISCLSSDALVFQAFSQK